MNVSIDWVAFLQVFVASMLGAVTVVTFYALGLRLMVRSGRAPVVTPAEFTDAITIISPKEARKAAKLAAKAAKKSPLTPFQKRLAFLGACLCFGACALAVLTGIYVLVVGH